MFCTIRSVCICEYLTMRTLHFCCCAAITNKPYLSYNGLCGGLRLISSDRSEVTMYRPAILIAGGDLRQLYCAARLAHEYEIAVTGFDSNAIPEELSLPCADPDRSYDFAVLPVPPLDGDGNISTPCSSAPLYTRTATDMLSPRGCILAGGVNRDLRESFPRHEICDYLLREELNQ